MYAVVVSCNVIVNSFYVSAYTCCKISQLHKCNNFLNRIVNIFSPFFEQDTAFDHRLISYNDNYNSLVSYPTPASGISYKQYHKTSAAAAAANGLHQNVTNKPWFSLLYPFPRAETTTSGIELQNDNTGTSCEIIFPGIYLLKNYISLADQVEIVKTCEDYAGLFYQPCDQSGQKLQLRMMSFGRHWDPQTRYDVPHRRDGSKPPPIPNKFISLVESSLKYAEVHAITSDKFLSMSPDVCTANFYTYCDRRGLHQNVDESSDSLERGSPVVSISIGDSAEFMYNYPMTEESRAEKILLESGDVLIFVGCSRLIYHGVKPCIPDTAPQPLLEETNLRPGHLNLTFRQF